ncbi:unnamed protein product [Pieris macdunnoughi]|uniref:Uncharacterized protein n=1 Tax=Pieris macdunnoughi TaxID=345717 RepID=A0A821LY44_9NEOP|nr:unnamed protein product [Pieris macdunnoughi]
MPCITCSKRPRFAAVAACCSISQQIGVGWGFFLHPTFGGHLLFVGYSNFFAEVVLQGIEVFGRFSAVPVVASPSLRSVKAALRRKRE